MVLNTNSNKSIISTILFKISFELGDLLLFDTS